MEEGRLDLEEGNTCWYCGGCRARSAAAVGTRNAESFRSKHGRSCGVEITRIVRHAVEATPVSGPPCSIEGLIEEVQAARRDETLITPGLDFVAEVLSTVQRMDTSQMSGNAEKDRAAPWRKADWQAGVASAARKRRLPPARRRVRSARASSPTTTTSFSCVTTRAQTGSRACAVRTPNASHGNGSRCRARPSRSVRTGTVPSIVRNTRRRR